MTAKKPPPLERKVLAPLLVTGMDGFDTLQYLRRREVTPKLGELEATGSLPAMPAALADTAYALWSEDAGIKSSNQVSTDRQYWRTLMEQTVETSAFQELSASTRGDWFLSTLGTCEAAQTLLKLVPDRDKDQLQEIAKAQAKADELEKVAADAEAEATGLEAMANGSGAMTGTEAQAMADQLAEQWAKAQAKADTARTQANAAQAQAQATLESLMGQPESDKVAQKLTELRRLGMAAVQAANTKVSAVRDTVQAWGLEPGELNRMEMPEAMALLERMRKNREFEQFAKLLGRLRRMAAKKAATKDEGEQRRRSKIVHGRDIGRAVQAEIINLVVHPVLRLQTMQRWARGELRLRGTEAKRTQGRGPVVVCEDASGSMSGTPQQWAKGVTLALAHYAKLQHRGFGWVMFDAWVHQAKTYPAGRLSAVELLEIAETTAGGGTNFEAPLRDAMKMVEAQGMSRADIVFVTDGDCAVSSVFLDEFIAWKKRREVSVVGVIIDTGHGASDATLIKFCDRVERASSFTAEEAEAKVFNNLTA